jgi:hypothetical protein
LLQYRFLNSILYQSRKNFYAASFLHKNTLAFLSVENSLKTALKLASQQCFEECTEAQKAWSPADKLGLAREFLRRVPRARFSLEKRECGSEKHCCEAPCPLELRMVFLAKTKLLKTVIKVKKD